MENNTNKKSKNFILVLIFVILSLATVSKVYNKYLDKSKKAFSSQTIDKEFEFKLSEINNDLEIKSLNGKVKLEGYEGEDILLKASYISKEKGYEVDFYRDNSNNFILDYDTNKFKSVSVDVLVPEGFFKNVEISSFNSSSNIDNLSANKLILTNMNGDIRITNLNAKQLVTENMNGEITLKDLNLKDVEVNNINGEITLDNFDVKNVKINNLNSSVSISTMGMLKSFDSYKWQVDNQNGEINVEIVEPNNINYNLYAETTNGEVTINKDNSNLTYSENTGKKVSAKTYNPRKSDKSLNLSLKTTNSTIVLN